ncbi:hypothetical protein RYX56_05600 [Alkalihalophilus lindianensis]|uniref:Uncharacterized protein n=1 Tax=Alkalihalophilus lindianensis TaxID=1630542 RepID=A0ABU3X7A4_9BACI|nr:hypothetical protein [Alkalihalophilus lindianensis]MDV2683783.1 hypothetical protein [Alkalihalophilus lindianensis]MDV2683849.1 hypothetical protein [Alkalihalophilus lindianensis]
MSFTSVLRSAARTFSSHKKPIKSRYKMLDSTYMLHSYEDLEELYRGATTTSDYVHIINHMDRHNVLDYGRYGSLASQMINDNGEFRKRWHE